MAGIKDIQPGTRMQMGLAAPPGKPQEFDLISTFKEALDESAFLVSIPLKGASAVQLDENQKVYLKYTIGTEAMVIAAYKDDIVKVGVRSYWKMRRVSEQRQFFQRQDERYKVALHLEYYQPTWQPNSEGEIMPDEALSLDMSAGGAAVFMHHRFEVGEVCMVNLPKIGTAPEGAALSGVVAAICWYREAPKGSPYKNLCGLQFRYSNEADKEVVKNYVANIKTVYKL